MLIMALKLLRNCQQEILNSFELGAASKEFRETNFSSTVEDVMAKAGKDQDFDEILSRIGPDATATFDNSPSNPREHASSEATNAATAVDGEDGGVEGEDDAAGGLGEDDELGGEGGC